MESLPIKKNVNSVIYNGKVKIHNNFYNVILKYNLDSGYLHIIFIFYIPSIEKDAQSILKTVQKNPGFIPF